jgi:formate hydrogenlyase subunit 4
MLKTIINIGLLFILPFFFLGLINKVKSWWAGRKGPPLLQSLQDTIKLLKKGEVISTTTSFVFRIAPAITFASIISAGMIVPLAWGKSTLSFEADFILFAYLLSVGKFVAIVGAMDTGSSFEGMGASREAAFSAMVEPAFFMIIASFALIAGGLSFGQIITLSHSGSITVILPLGIIALFIILLAEGCRVPVDDPNTHLELTMIHEVMVLDNSGPDMGFIIYAAGMKMVIISAIIANLSIPTGLPFWSSLVAFIAVLAILAVVIGTIESLMARLRMTHVPQFLLFTMATAWVITATIVLFSAGGFK